jgi:ketosteroid isomerase-like protein
LKIFAPLRLCVKSLLVKYRKEDAMTRFLIACASVVSLLLFCSSSVAADDKATLLKMVDEGFSALNAKNIAAFEKLHVTDQSAVHIDAGEGQVYVGWPAAKKAFENTMQMNPRMTNQKNIALNVDGNSAWGVWTFDSHMDMEGKPITTPMRLTLVFKGSGGKWLVTHSHVSAGLPPPPGGTK